MEAYQKVQEFDLSSGADWKTTANVLFTVPPSTRSSDKSACKALDDISIFINCSRVWSVGEDITMIFFQEVQGADGISAVSGDGGTAAHLMAWCRAVRAPTRKAMPLPGVEVVVPEADDASVRRGDKPGDLLLILWDICYVFLCMACVVRDCRGFGRARVESMMRWGGGAWSVNLNCWVHTRDT
ncbi:uncharacterized protein [Triticum aestivum]|uniref:uncharacterized protein isoform X2 n=1 Tax=Triticum aestivum TaxID=4565 RepID=UPI001D02F287|nr:uncharacterized protein LOC123110896 isoform X2 [Triticum aestivum]